MVSFSLAFRQFFKYVKHRVFLSIADFAFRKEKNMQDIIKEYGPAVITVIAIGAMIILVRVLIGTGAESIVGKAFQELLTKMLTFPTT
jgi:hypothetical protein